MRFAPDAAANTVVKFDQAGRQLLEACSLAEKLSMSEIVRRAVREYARKLGVVPQPPVTP